MFVTTGRESYFKFQGRRRDFNYYRDNQPLPVYCKTHDVSVCHLCAVINHQRPCELTDVNDAIAEKKQHLLDLQATARDKTTMWKKSMVMKYVFVGRTQRTILNLFKIRAPLHKTIVSYHSSYYSLAYHQS